MSSLTRLLALPRAEEYLSCSEVYIKKLYPSAISRSLSGLKPKYFPRYGDIATYALIGTMFDYLMRIKLNNMLPDLHFLDTLLGSKVYNKCLYMDNGFNTKYASTAISLNSYMSTLESCIPVNQKSVTKLDFSKLCNMIYILSLLDNLYRQNLKIPDFVAKFNTFVSNNHTIPNSEILRDIYELNKLLNLDSFLSQLSFKKESQLYLNPILGGLGNSLTASDADLLLNSTLIDIKTTKNATLIPDSIQCLSYLILWLFKYDSRSCSISEMTGYTNYSLYNQLVLKGEATKEARINFLKEKIDYCFNGDIPSIGVYYSRYGMLLKSAPLFSKDNNELLLNFVQCVDSFIHLVSKSLINY